MSQRFEGWDFDGTICHAPKGFSLRLYRIIESFFPFITVILPVRKKPKNPEILIITASQNKVGVMAWLRLHRVKYHSILFVRNFQEKKYFIDKLCNCYIEIE